MHVLSLISVTDIDRIPSVCGEVAQNNELVKKSDIVNLLKVL